MTRFSFEATSLAGLIVVERHPIGDTRGFLERLWCQDEWRELFADRSISQINHTFTAQPGTVRGLHFQNPPYSEAKYITCLRGRVLDVAVDIRRGSPTFLDWHAEVLSSDNHRSLFIPEGFAHGFQTLSAECEMIYVHSQPHMAEFEGGVNAMDPRLGIRWPLPVVERSVRDTTLPMLADEFVGVHE